MSILGEAVVRVVADMADFNRQVTAGLNNAGQKFRSAGASMTSAGSSLTRSVTLPLAGLGAAAFTTAADFEAAMTQITALVGIPREQVKAWGGDVRDLAVTYGKSSVEAADALYFITSAGIDASQALDVLNTSLKASASGLGDTATIADAVTSAMNAYESSNLSAAEAADILAAAVKFGKLEATELAPVLGRLLPTASALNISFADVSGALAVMSRTGLDAAEASTSLSAIMSTLLKPTAQSTALLREAGLSMADLRAQAAGPDGLIGVMRTLEGAFGDNDEALATIVPNVRAFRGVMNVLAQDAGTVDEVMRGVANATGSLDTAFAEVSQTAKFQLAQTMESMRELLVEIGQTVMPLVVAGMEVLRDKIAAVSAWWDGLSEETRKFIVYAAGAAAAIGPILLGLGTFLKLGGGLLTLLPQVTALFGPWGIAIGLVTVALAGLVNENFDLEALADRMVESITSFVDRLPDLIPRVVDGVERLVGGIVEALPILVDAGAQIIVALAEGIAELVPSLIPAAVEAVITLERGIVSALPTLVDAGITAVLALLDGMLEAWPDLLEAGAELIPELVESLTDLLPKLIDGGIRLVFGLLDGVLRALPRIITAVVGMIPVLLRSLVNAIPSLIDGGIQLVLGLLDGIVTSIPLIIEAVIGAIPVIIEALIEAGPLVAEGGIQLVVGLVTGIVGAIPDLLLEILKLVILVAAELGKAVGLLWQKGGEWISSLWGGIVDRWEAVIAWFQELPGKVAGFFADAGKWLVNAGKNIINGLWSGMKDTWNKVTGWVSGLGGWISDHKGPEQYDRQLLVPAGGWIMEGLEEGIVGSLPSLRRALGTVSDAIRIDAPQNGFVSGGRTGGVNVTVAPGAVQITVSGNVTREQAEDTGTAAAQAFLARLSHEAVLR